MKLIKTLFIVSGCLAIPFIFGSVSYGTNYDATFVVIGVSYNTLTKHFENEALGSAIKITNDTIVTNAHVVSIDEDDIYAHFKICKYFEAFGSIQCFANAQVDRIDETNDLATLKITKTFDGTFASSALPVIDTSLPKITSEVFIAGYPDAGGNTLTVTKGIVAGFKGNKIKIDAAINHGNSGGGARNKDGKLIGVVSYSITDIDNIGYIIPIEYVNKLVQGTSGEKIVTKQFTNTPDFEKLISAEIGEFTSQFIETKTFSLDLKKLKRIQLVGNAGNRTNETLGYTFRSTENENVSVSVAKVLLSPLDDAISGDYFFNNTVGVNDVFTKTKVGYGKIGSNKIWYFVGKIKENNQVLARFFYPTQGIIISFIGAKKDLQQGLLGVATIMMNLKLKNNQYALDNEAQDNDRSTLKDYAKISFLPKSKNWIGNLTKTELVLKTGESAQSKLDEFAEYITKLSEFITDQDSNMTSNITMNPLTIPSIETYQASDKQSKYSLDLIAFKGQGSSLQIYNATVKSENISDHDALLVIAKKILGKYGIQ